MIKEVANKEIKNTIFAMNNKKALRSDGFKVIFFGLNIIGNEVYEAMKHFFFQNWVSF